MKAPTNYGSDNEETRFIRRVATPDRPNSKRRQKKRLAVAGAALGLLAASAGIGYATLRTANTTSAMETMQLEADRAFVSKLGDAFHPSFETVKLSNLSNDIEENMIELLEEKLKSDVDCTRQASDERKFPVTKEDAGVFYYLLDVFCPIVTITVTQPEGSEKNNMYNQFTEHNTEQVTVEIPTPQGNKEQDAVEEEETPTGEEKLEIPDGEGGVTPVT
ncbi:hypothetical protein BBJ29_007170 [Phytophthora kernoviae]|uniref:Uncharacterized protein n=1 Tax=Phytophthora kernoviae TaxID=325452 RepID=A0A3F2RHX3_9STRA|nr:hypothetical protein BBJ29_007170 [Phytophthora kernoviae]RLN57351.1 hypothetical protein BBP00_00007541 [Phytophthora kernoviae]